LNTKLVWVFLFVSLLSIPFATGISAVQADSTGSATSYSVVKILFPSNRTYDSRLLTLEVTFPASCLRYSLNYDLDGKYEGPVPFWIVNPTEVHVVYEARGAVELPVLSDGSHRVTVSIECSVDIYGGNAPSGPFKPTTPNGTHFVATWADTVYFTIDSNASTQDPPLTLDSTPPIIFGLSLQDRVYTAPDVPLNFTVNEATSRLTVSLDGNDNVTIAGNTTLTGLSVGAHNLTVYAWDAAGNVGASKTIHFYVADPPSAPIQPIEPIPTASVDGVAPSLVVTSSVAAAALVAIGVLVFFKRRKREAKL